MAEAAHKGEYHLVFSVVFKNRDSNDTLHADGSDMVIKLMGKKLAGPIEAQCNNKRQFSFEMGETWVVFDYPIKDETLLRDILQVGNQDELQWLQLVPSGADTPVISEKTGKNVLNEQSAAKARRPNTFISVEFGELESLSPWLVSRRHTAKSGTQGTSVTLREALQAIEGAVGKDSDTLPQEVFVFSNENWLERIVDRPLLDKNDDYQMFAVRLEKENGTPELHLPTSKVLDRQIRDYTAISLFSFTFDEFINMAVLFPQKFSGIKKEVEDWLGASGNMEAQAAFANRFEKRQMEDDICNLPEDKELITRDDVERYRLRADAGVQTMQCKYATCLYLEYGGVGQKHTDAMAYFNKAGEMGKSALLKAWKQKLSLVGRTEKGWICLMTTLANEMDVPIKMDVPIRSSSLVLFGRRSINS